MKVLLDTNVLYPTVMREMLLGCAAQGLFTPLWSDRILAEWAHTGLKQGAAGQVATEAEIARTRAAWPGAEVTWPPSMEARLWLPDPADIHVLAAAIAGSADVICTANAKDFPRNILAEEGVGRADPDALLMGLLAAQPDIVARVGNDVLATARRLSGEDWTARRLFRKARLPRLAKALSRD